MQEGQESEDVVAAYGASCEVCVKAKRKCLYHAGNDKCQRCIRLDKECKKFQVRRRAAARKNDGTTSARTARLEEKLDKVLESLQPRRSSHVSPSPVSDSLNWVSSNKGASVRLSSIASRPFSAFTPPSDDAATSTHSKFTPLAEAQARKLCSTRASRVWKLANVSPAAAKERLLEFRTKYLEWFPFVYIPATTTSEQLRHERPFLWLNIMFLASHDTAQYSRMGDVLRREIAEAMVVDAEKSLDLLLGLLVFIGWYHTHCQCTDGSVKLSLSLLTQLAISLVFDLQLNKREPKPPTVQMLGVDSHKALRLPYPRTLESKRAGIAVFLIASTMAVWIQRIDPLRWTPYFADNLLELEQNAEWEGDRILVQQVRMQLVVDRIHSITWSDNLPETNDNVCLPVAAYVQTLQAQLDHVRDGLTPEQQANPLLQLHYQNNKINISGSISNHPRPQHPIPPSAPPLSLTRTTHLSTSFAAAKAYFATYFTLSASSYPFFSFSMTTQTMHCLSLLFDLSILDDPGWDKHLVRAEVDVLAYLDAVTLGFEEAAPLLSVSSAGLGGDGDENAFQMYVRFLKQGRPVVKARLEEAVQGMVGEADVMGNETEMTFDFDFLGNPLFWNFGTGFESASFGAGGGAGNAGGVGL